MKPEHPLLAERLALETKYVVGTATSEETRRYFALDRELAAAGLIEGRLAPPVKRTSE